MTTTSDQRDDVAGAGDTTLSYCVKYSRKQPPWRGPVVWTQPDPEIGDVIEIEGETYRVLDAAVAIGVKGWSQRHISAFVQRDPTPTSREEA